MTHNSPSLPGYQILQIKFLQANASARHKRTSKSNGELGCALGRYLVSKWIH